VVARRQAEEATGNGSGAVTSVSANRVGQRLLGLLEGAADVVDADAPPVVLNKTRLGQS
jgi:hypothetical protein